MQEAVLQYYANVHPKIKLHGVSHIHYVGDPMEVLLRRALQLRTLKNIKERGHVHPYIDALGATLHKQ